jgi:hypothetical protein
MLSRGHQRVTAIKESKLETFCNFGETLRKEIKVDDNNKVEKNQTK